MSILLLSAVIILFLVFIIVADQREKLKDLHRLSTLKRKLVYRIISAVFLVLLMVVVGEALAVVGFEIDILKEMVASVLAVFALVMSAVFEEAVGMR